MTQIRIDTVNGNVVIGNVNVGFAIRRRMPVLASSDMAGTSGHFPGQLERRATQRPPTEIDQRDLQQTIDRLSDRSPVLDFMEREYGTSNILELESNQLYHLRWYVEVLLRRN